MLRVAIVGCGKIADAHASQIRRIAGCEIVGVCDTEPLMARQLAERFPVAAHFSDVNALIAMRVRTWCTSTPRKPLRSGEVVPRARLPCMSRNPSRCTPPTPKS